MINSADTYKIGDNAYGKEANTTKVSPPKIKKIFSGVEDISEGDEAHQPHSEGVLDWGIRTPT